MFIAGMFDNEVNEYYKMIGIFRTYDNSESQRILGIKFRDIKQSVIEMAESLIDTGFIAKL